MARDKRKTAGVTLRIEPRPMAAAEWAAEHDQRRLTNLIVERCKTLNINIDASASTE
jgi:hypothetical protein